jgi:hypothetical protein
MPAAKTHFELVEMSLRPLRDDLGSQAYNWVMRLARVCLLIRLISPSKVYTYGALALVSQA